MKDTRFMRLSRTVSGTRSTERAPRDGVGVWQRTWTVEIPSILLDSMYDRIEIVERFGSVSQRSAWAIMKAGL